MYKELVQRLRDIYDLRSAQAVLEWDMETYMPPKGGDARSRQMGLLAALAHEKLADPRLGELLEGCKEHEAGFAEEQRAVVREVKRDREKAVKVPSELVREITDTAGKSLSVWKEARERKSFKIFVPLLTKLIDLKKREAEALGYAAGGVPYDALLDRYEPGASVAKLNPIIGQTRDITVAAVRAIGASKKKPKIALLERVYLEDAQEKLGRFVIEKMGYDLQSGRLDVAVHPFSTSFDPNDVRITTRYEQRWLPAALFGCVHEAGHALYEQGLPIEHGGTPLCESLSLGIHESQSRLWENQIGRSKAFWRFLYPKAKRLFPKALGKVSLDDFYFAVNGVRPSMIRVEADEVTYNLHVVVRYEIEQAIFSGEAAIDDLPGLWNRKMKDYLGIAPKNDAEGILQDIHWAMGSFGYFPTYLLGNLYAAQWMSAMRRGVRDLDGRVAKGDLLAIKKWLNENIHCHGRRYSTSELARRVSGEDLNPKFFEQYLKEKFGPLYEVSW